MTVTVFHPETRYYTLLLVDPDVPDPEHRGFTTYLHWMQYVLFLDYRIYFYNRIAKIIGLIGRTLRYAQGKWCFSRTHTQGTFPRTRSAGRRTTDTHCCFCRMVIRMPRSGCRMWQMMHDVGSMCVRSARSMGWMRRRGEVLTCGGHYGTVP